MLRMFLSLVAITTLFMLRPQVQSAPQSARSSQPPRPAVVTNINTASLAELQTLPGVGTKTAARIIDYRQQNGPFKTIEELMNVQGIDDKSFRRLKPQITVAGSAGATEHRLILEGGSHHE
jgi:comEA protein